MYLNFFYQAQAEEAEDQLDVARVAFTSANPYPK
jgi:hypothetical protein